MIKRNMRIGDILIECGCATPEEVRAAIRVQAEDRSKRLGEILLDMGIVTEDQLLVALGERLKVSVVDFESVDIDLSVADMVPQSVCVKYQMIPIYKSQGNVIIAVNDPMDFYAIEDVKSFIQDQSEIVLCNKADLKKMIDKAFAELNTRKAADKAGADLIASTKLVGMDDIGAVDSNKEAPVVALVNSILVKAYSDGARENNCSDIHLTAELPPVYRRYGEIMVSDLPYDAQEIESSILSMLDHDQLRKVNQRLDIDLCYSLTETQRQRVNIYYQHSRVDEILIIIKVGMTSHSRLHINVYANHVKVRDAKL